MCPFCPLVCSACARGSGARGRAACQIRAGWSRPAIGTPSDVVTQRDSRRHESCNQAAIRWRFHRGHRSRPSSGLNPHSCGLPSPGGVLPVKTRPDHRGLSRSRQPPGHQRGDIEGPPEVHPRYICTLTCQYPDRTGGNGMTRTTEADARAATPGRGTGNCGRPGPGRRDADTSASRAGQAIAYGPVRSTAAHRACPGWRAGRPPTGEALAEGALVADDRCGRNPGLT